MSKLKSSHPYHYEVSKNIVQRIIDLAIPTLLFWAYFSYYNFGKFTPSEMIKTSGLFAIALLSLTLIIGPLCRFFPGLDFLKAHRKFWGIVSFIAVIAHITLIFVYYYKFDLYKFVDFSNPKYPGILAGIISAVILLIITLTSNKFALKSLRPSIWKAIQTTGYLALILAIVHFYIVESVGGVLVIKRVVGQITFGFAALAVAIRLLVMLLPKKS